MSEFGSTSCRALARLLIATALTLSMVGAAGPVYGTEAPPESATTEPDTTEPDATEPDAIPTEPDAIPTEPDPTPTEPAPERAQSFLVIAESGFTAEQIKARAVALGVSVESLLQGQIEGVTAELTATQRAALSKEPGVDYIERDIEVSISSTAIRTDVGCSTNSMANVDDVSSGSIALGFPVNWFGTEYSAIIINNNGGISFDDGLGDFRSYRGVNLDTTSRPLILPLFTDLDTTITDPVRHGAITADGRSAYCVNWINVGEYPNGAASQSFQLVIINQGSGNIDLEFNYSRVSTPSSSSNPTFVIGYADPNNRTNSLVRVRSTDPAAPYADGGSSSLVANKFPSTGSVAGRYTYAIRPTETVIPPTTPTPTTPGSSNCNPTAQTPVTWGLDRIDQRALPLSDSYACAGDGTGVLAYIVDTGISSNSDFASRLNSGISYVSGSSSTTDCHGHGTHVAGIVGGIKYGVAKNVGLVPVRVLDCSGRGSTSGVVSGLNWIGSLYNDASDPLYGQPAVVNMSLGGGTSKSLDDSVTALVSLGITVVVAAGNDNADAANFSPARVASAITVGATTSTDVRASYSNFGSVVDLFAPGSSIVSTWNTSSTATATLSGTSMAAPFVAGAAAIYLGLNRTNTPPTTPAQVATALINASTTDAVTNPGSGSPNRLLYARSFSADPSDSPAAPGGGSSSGGSSGGGGGSSGGGSSSGGGGSAVSDDITSTEDPITANQVSRPGEFQIRDLAGTPVQLRRAELTSTGFSIAGSDWELVGRGPLSSASQQVLPGQQISITGEGLQRLTTTGIYVLSQPTWVGAGIVGYDNKFTASFLMPQLAAGNHTLQINMVRQGKLPISIAIGFTLGGSPTAGSKVPGSSASAPETAGPRANLIYFPRNSAKLTSASKRKLDSIAKFAQQSSARVIIESFQMPGNNGVSRTLARKRASSILSYTKSKGASNVGTAVKRGVHLTQGKAVLVVTGPAGSATQEASAQVGSLIVRYTAGTKPGSQTPLTGTEKITAVPQSDLSLGDYLGFQMYQVNFRTPVSREVASKVVAQMSLSSVVEFAEPNQIVSTQIALR